MEEKNQSKQEKFNNRINQVLAQQARDIVELENDIVEITDILVRILVILKEL